MTSIEQRDAQSVLAGIDDLLQLSQWGGFDAPIFVAAQQEAERIKATSFSVIEVLKRYPRGVITAMGLRFDGGWSAR